MSKQSPNRSVPPPVAEPAGLHLPEPSRHHLDNGIEVVEIRMGTQDILKLEISFRAGRPFEQQKLVGRATAGMLREGSRNHTAAEVAEALDFYGGTLTIPVNLDFSVITLYTLKRHLEPLLQLIRDMLVAPLFPQKELGAFIDRSMRRLEVDLNRNDVLAYREVTERIFGPDHPYGYNSLPTDYQALNRDLLVEHFENAYTTGNCTIFISGRTDDRTISLLNTYLGRGIREGSRKDQPVPVVKTSSGSARIPHSDQVQSAIRIGRNLFSRHHADFPGMYVLNTVLGGYFGSRLMENIREEKGFTYNIYSAIDPMLYGGYFYIGTEVGTAVTEAAIREIYVEIARLQEELVEEEELQMVRNYLLGNMLTMLDGPFNVADIIRTQESDGLPHVFFEKLCNTIRTIEAEDLRKLAQKYLQPADLWEVVVG